MSLFELVLNTEYKGQSCVNRWNYVSTSVPASTSLSFGLIAATGFLEGTGDIAFPDETMAAAIQNLQNAGVIFRSIISKNVYDLADFFSTPFNTGTIGTATSGDQSSPLLAYGLHSNQTTRKVRAGTKRFVGVSEGFMLDGGGLDTTSLAQLAVIASFMNDAVSYNDSGSILQYQPVIVHKQKITDPDTGKVKYVYFPTYDEQVPDNVAFNVVWSAMDTVRSQTSRQYKRGR